MITEGDLFRYLSNKEAVMEGDEWSIDNVNWYFTYPLQWGQVPEKDYIIRRKVKRKVIVPDDIETRVCNDIKERQANGIQKYGMTVANNPLELKEWVQHAYEECLDQAVYLKRILQSLEEKNVQPDNH